MAIAFEKKDGTVIDPWRLHWTAKPSLRGGRRPRKQSNYPHDVCLPVTLSFRHRGSWIAASAYGLLAKTASPPNAIGTHPYGRTTHKNSAATGGNRAYFKVVVGYYSYPSAAFLLSLGMVGIAFHLRLLLYQLPPKNARILILR